MRASTVGPRVGRVAIVALLAAGAALVGASVAQVQEMQRDAKIRADFIWTHSGDATTSDFIWT